MPQFIHARVYPGADDDLIAWLAGQPEGRRSEAIRMLLRDGLQVRELRMELVEAIRQTMIETLQEVQLVAAQQGGTLATNQVEEAFGSQLDRLLDAFS